MGDSLLYVKNILEAIEKIKKYTEGMDFEDFVEDEKTVDAVVGNLEIIGDAAKHIPDEFKASHPGVPWKEITGMRDKLIHAYFGMDLSLLWYAVQNELEILEHAMVKLLEGRK